MQEHEKKRWFAGEVNGRLQMMENEAVKKPPGKYWITSEHIMRSFPIDPTQETYNPVWTGINFSQVPSNKGAVAVCYCVSEKEGQRVAVYDNEWGVSAVFSSQKFAYMCNGCEAKLPRAGIHVLYCSHPPSLHMWRTMLTWKYKI